MKINVLKSDLTKFKCDCVIVNLFEGVKTPGGATGASAADKALGGAITDLIKKGEITGKYKETRIIHTRGAIEAERVLVAGLGKSEDFTFERIRHISAEALKAAKRVGATKIATIVHGAGIAGLDAEKSAQALVEGAILGTYSFKKYLTKPGNGKEIEELSILEADANKIKAIEQGAKQGEILADATNFAKDLVNEPANALTPTELAKRAASVAKESNLECEVLDKADMEKLGMGVLLSVSKGSDEPPKFIVLKYKGNNSKVNPALSMAREGLRRKGGVNLGLIGKGITFDSGGISIKPAEGMQEMKGDMAGGAAVIAAMSAIAKLKPKINVTAIIPAVENMPSGKASRPGDVVKAMNGKSVEIISTDAEGRMLLADALCYANKLKLTHLVDVATLTRACAVALGNNYAGAFANNKELMKEVASAAAETGEKIWEFPLAEDYKDELKSDVADMKNVGSRYGGSITAALFLSDFAGKTPWVHLDIAGPAYSEKEDGYNTKGGRGFGVRLLVNLTLEWEWGRST